jgi:hypothetical protein
MTDPVAAGADEFAAKVASFVAEGLTRLGPVA